MAGLELGFDCETAAGRNRRSVRIDDLVIAGWTGRDRVAMEAHIAELEKLGVARPASMPTYYRVAASLLTTAPAIDVAGQATSGEVEVVLVSLDDGIWVGLGSDHTDRKAEAQNVTLSKQLCAKPIAPVLWRFAELADHWDRLLLRCHVIEGGRRLYQDGSTSLQLRPKDLIAGYANGPALPPGTAMFCGTFAVIGDITPAECYELGLEDPILGRVIAHRYSVRSLPVVG